jgi:hypothetical protein
MRSASFAFDALTAALELSHHGLRLNAVWSCRSAEISTTMNVWVPAMPGLSRILLENDEQREIEFCFASSVTPFSRRPSPLSGRTNAKINSSNIRESIGMLCLASRRHGDQAQWIVGRK